MGFGKLVNESGSLLVYAFKFWHEIEFVIDCVDLQKVGWNGVVDWIHSAHNSG